DFTSEKSSISGWRSERLDDVGSCRNRSLLAVANCECILRAKSYGILRASFSAARVPTDRVRVFIFGMMGNAREGRHPLHEELAHRHRNYARTDSALPSSYARIASPVSRA